MNQTAFTWTKMDDNKPNYILNKASISHTPEG